MYRRTISPEERDQISADNAQRFKDLHPAYYSCSANSEKLMSWLTAQLGSDYHYPFSLENFIAAWTSINEHGWFIQRPPDPAIAAAQERAQRDADNRLIEHAERVGEWVAVEQKKLYDKPLEELRQDAIQERSGLAARREAAGHVSKVGAESKHVVVGELAQARLRVAVSHPEISRESKEFAELVREEMRNPTSSAAVSRSHKPVSAQERQVARQKVALQNPTLSRDSVTFNDLVNQELQS
jgi:hypothetical protein